MRWHHRAVATTEQIDEFFRLQRQAPPSLLRRIELWQSIGELTGPTHRDNIVGRLDVELERLQVLRAAIANGRSIDTEIYEFLATE